MKERGRSRLRKSGGKKVKAKAIQKTTVHTKKKTSLKAKKLGLKKTTPSAKQPSKKASLKGNLMKRDQLKKSPSKNNLQIAQARANLGNCPVSMPQIQSVIVFQSVEAPQIEPMNQQDWFPYDDYDLVQGKPAGVLVHLDRGRMDRRKEFAVDLLISGENEYRKKCFHEPMKGEMREEEQDFCFFTRNNLKREGDFKFFPLPMNEDVLNKSDIDRTVKVTLFPIDYANNKSCHEKRSFEIKVIKTHDLKIGFTRIGGDCYFSSSYDRVKEFASSPEVRINIKSMFPIKKLFSSALVYKWKGQNWDYIKGTCNNSSAKKVESTVGLLSDVAELERIRASLGYHKLIAIVPESYFTFHRGIRGVDHDSVGFIISPRWRYWKWYWFFGTRWYKSGFLGGSWNVAFVHEDELDTGIVAHELAHTVGQEKEFYEDHERCRRFRGSNFESCEKYKITRALSTRTYGGRGRWKFLKNRFSIMSGKIPIGKRDADIHDLWIDRDTYQKTFKILSKKAVIPNTEELFGESIVNREYQGEEESSLKAVITGFYYEKERNFIVPDIRVQKTKLSTPSFYPNTENTKLPVVIFQLREGKRVLQRIKIPIFKMQIKTLYKAKNPKTKPFEFSPLISAFKLPPDYKRRSLRIVVLDTWLDPWGKKMYSVAVPKRSKPKPRTSGANAVEKNKRR